MTTPITICFLTYARTDYALATIRGVRTYLRYPDLRWYVADDGSREEHVEAVMQALDGELIVGMHSVRRGYGASANRAWTRANEISPLSFWLEDDWELREPLDLWPYAALLMEDDSVGMVRLGVLNPEIRGSTFDHGGATYWRLDRIPARDGIPVFCGHPSLRHNRYQVSYGKYPEHLAPGDTELAYSYQYRIGIGSSIVWPSEVPGRGVFGHIGTIKTEHLERSL